MPMGMELPIYRNIYWEPIPRLPAIGSFKLLILIMALLMTGSAARQPLMVIMLWWAFLVKMIWEWIPGWLGSTGIQVTTGKQRVPWLVPTLVPMTNLVFPWLLMVLMRWLVPTAMTIRVPMPGPPMSLNWLMVHGRKLPNWCLQTIQLVPTLAGP